MSRRLATVVQGAVLTGAALLPLLWSSYYTLQAAQVLMVAVAVVGLALVMGLAGQVSLGHAAFFAVGAYVTAWFQRAEWLGGHEYLIGLPVAFLSATLVSGLIAVVILRLQGLQLAIVTLGLTVMTAPIIKRFDWATGGPQGLHVPRPDDVEGIAREDVWYLVTVAAAMVSFWLASNLIRSRTGKAWKALRDHPVAAAGVGIDVAAGRRAAFALSGGFAGLAGGLFAIINGYLSPETFGLTRSIDFVVGLVIGGASVIGAIAGGAFVQLSPVWFSDLNRSAPGVLYGVALIVVMFVLPSGLTGLLVRGREMASPALGRLTSLARRFRGLPARCRPTEEGDP